MCAIPDDHLVNICRYRSGESTCKYIFYVLSLSSFCCGKNIAEVKKKIDECNSMCAKGDNCDGRFVRSTDQLLQAKATEFGCDEAQ